MSSTVVSVGMLTVLEMAPGEERLSGRHHPHVGLPLDAPLAVGRLEGTVEDRKMLVLQMRSTFDRVVLFDVRFDLVDLRVVVAQRAQAHAGPTD